MGLIMLWIRLYLYSDSDLVIARTIAWCRLTHIWCRLTQEIFGRTLRMKNVQNTVKDTIFDACAELQEQVLKQTTQVANFCRDSRLRETNNLQFTPFYNPGYLILNIFYFNRSHVFSYT